jgi:hypothetical protein
MHGVIVVTLTDPWATHEVQCLFHSTCLGRNNQLPAASVAVWLDDIQHVEDVRLLFMHDLQCLLTNDTRLSTRVLELLLGRVQQPY